jgi:ATP synthase protein I
MLTTAPNLHGRPQDEAVEPEFTPMTAEQARMWRQRNPSVSPWWVVAAQVVVGALVAALAWLVTDRPSAAASAAYGALAVVLPAAVFARGLTSRVFLVNPGMAVFGFFLWEMVKIALTVAMLFAAPRLITALSWPAMLAGLVVTMKVYWVALAFRRKNAEHPKF